MTVKDCSNCSNNTWGDGVGPFQTVCIRCGYVEEDGVKVPSNWNPKPMTNADRIRSMTDEELAELLRDAYDAGCNDASAWECGTRQYTFTWDEEWLRQPAEEVQSNA